MKVVKQGRAFVIICNEEEVSMLEDALSVLVSEYDFGRPEPWLGLANQMMVDIDNMEDCS